MGSFTESTIFFLLIKFFILIFIGYVLRKTNQITEQFEKDLGAFLMRVVLPFSIIRSANTTFSMELSRNLIYSGIFAVAYYVFSLIFLFILMRFVPSTRDEKKIAVTLGTFANTSFLGFPIVEELFGRAGLLYAVTYNFVFLFSFLVFAEAYVSGKRTGVFKSIITNPGIIASVLAVPIFLSPVKLPAVIDDCFRMMGSMMTPISLLIIGCRMTSIHLWSIFTDRLAWLVTAMRLAVFPALAYILLLPFHLDPTLTAALTLITGLPSGAMNVIIANQYDCGVDLASKAVALSTIVMLGTLPVLMMVIG